MSDSLALLNKTLSGGNLDIPRYYDVIHPETEEPKETAQEVISRFDRLRRK